MTGGILKEVKEMNNTSQHLRKNKGFTLVEIMVVISVIGVLATILVPNVSGIVNKAKKSAAQGTVNSAYTALNAYFNDNGDYPRGAPLMAGYYAYNASYLLRDFLRDYSTFDRWETFLLDPWRQWMSYHGPLCWGTVGAIYSHGPDLGNNTWSCDAWRYWGFWGDDIGQSIKKF